MKENKENCVLEESCLLLHLRFLFFFPTCVFFSLLSSSVAVINGEPKSNPNFFRLLVLVPDSEQDHISRQPPPPGALVVVCNKVATIIFPSGFTGTSTLPTVHKPGVRLGCVHLEETDRKGSYLDKVKTLECCI